MINKKSIHPIHITLRKYTVLLLRYILICASLLLLNKQSLAISTTDSLKNQIERLKGTERLKTLKELGDTYNSTSDYDSAFVFERMGLKEAEQLNNQMYIAIFYSSIGVTYWNRGEHKLAIENLKKAEKICTRTKNLKTLSAVYNNLGLVYFEVPNYPTALSYLDKALSLAKKMKDKSSEASALLNIGLVYDDSQQYEKALTYYHKALKLAIELKEDETQMICYGNMGVVYGNLGKRNEGMEMQIKSLNLAEKIKNKRGMALANNNIGAVLFDQKKYDEAQLFYDQAYHLYITVKDLNGIVLVLNNLGDINGIQGRYQKALQYYHEAMLIADTAELYDNLSVSYIGLSQTYAELKQFEKAFQYHVAYKANEDTLASMRNMNSLNEIKTKFEVHQKELELNAKQEKERAINNANRKQQTIIIIFIVVLLLLTVIFSGFLFKRIRLSVRQNKIIKDQKHLVEEKNKEIIDSINYAKRIQQSVITSERYLEQHLNEFFVLFIPKDIVAGDFYWALNTDAGFLMATGDCTGHGVPGAFMSMLGINYLNEITIEKKIQAPAQILNELRKGIIKSMNPDESVEDGKDGMDISLYTLDKKNLKLTYAAANNPIWVISNNEVKELKADKMPIGLYNGKEKEGFSQGEMQLNKGDIIYTFTDGYADQFGGEKGKKLKYSHLKTLLLEIHSLPLTTQKTYMQEAFLSWKGRYDQTDDVCLIGVKV